MRTLTPLKNNLKRRAPGRSQPPANNLIGLSGASRILGIDRRKLERLEDSLLIRLAIVERDGVRWFDVNVLHGIVEAVRQLIALQTQREEGRRRRAGAKTPVHHGGIGPAVAARTAAAGLFERPADRPVAPDYRPPVAYSPGRTERLPAKASATTPHRAAMPPLMPPPRGVLVSQPVRTPVAETAAPPPRTAFDEWANAPLPDIPDEDEDDDDGDAS